MVFEARQHGGELRILLAFGQDLQTEVVTTYVFLVDVQHGKQYIEQVAYAFNRYKFDHYWDLAPASLNSVYYAHLNGA